MCSVLPLTAAYRLLVRNELQGSLNPKFFFPYSYFRFRPQSHLVSRTYSKNFPYILRSKQGFRFNLYRDLTLPYFPFSHVPALSPLVSFINCLKVRSENRTHIIPGCSRKHHHSAILTSLSYLYGHNCDYIFTIVI